MLKEIKDKKGVKLMEEFMKSDTNGDLDLESVRELEKTLQGIGVDISKDHVAKLFSLY